MNDFLKEVKNYYTSKVMAHGFSAAGVDWKSEEGQKHRFEQLLKLVDFSNFFTVNDLGCGYGALYSYLKTKTSDFSYKGFDISEEMTELAKKNFYQEDRAVFLLSDQCDFPADYTITSGIFNVKLACSSSVWEKYIFDSIRHMNSFSRKGFAFNCLSSYSDPERRREDLFYANPLELFDFCKKYCSKNVALLHDYDLYEFTILVRK